MTDDQEQLGNAIDRLDSVAHALKLGLPAEMHVEQLRVLLPEIVVELKAAFVLVTGEECW